MGYKWKPLEEAVIDDKDYSDSKNSYFLDAAMEQYDLDRDAAIKMLQEYDDNCTWWRNDLYQVQMRPFHCEPLEADMVHLNIRRIDGGAVFDWRHRQLIKNQLVGEECEAVELYPAESRLVDTSNKYHLWCFAKPTFRMPFGFFERDVVTKEVKGPSGARQRGF